MYVMNADGTGEQMLSGDAACLWNVGGVRWSPDGSRIAYGCDEPGGQALYTIAANGIDAVRLSEPVGPGDYTSDGIPVWSPDGQRVAFVSGRGGQYDLYVVSAAGGATTRLTEDSAMELPSDWRRPR